MEKLWTVMVIEDDHKSESGSSDSDSIPVVKSTSLFKVNPSAFK